MPSRRRRADDLWQAQVRRYRHSLTALWPWLLGQYVTVSALIIVGLVLGRR